MAVTTSKYGIQKIFKIRGYNIVTDELELDLKKMKQTTFSNGQTTVYLDGGQANSRQASFDHSKVANISGASAQIDENLMSAQTGAAVELLTNTTEIEFEDIQTVTIADTLTAKYIPTGTANNEVKFAYILNTDGSVDTTQTKEQAAALAVDKFTVTAGAVAFQPGEAPVGTKIKLIYFPTAASAKKIANTTQTFSKTLRIVCDALLKDVCTDQLVKGQILARKGKIMGEFTWDLTSDGNPAVHDFNCELLENCDEQLWDFFVYDEADLT